MLNNARGFAHIGALVVGFLVVCFVGYFAKQQIAIYNERKTYREAEVQITQFTNAAAKLAPSTKEIRKYCSYSSAKYSRGTLGCAIDSSVKYEDIDDAQVKQIMERANAILSSARWHYLQDNTWNYTNYPKAEISSSVYQFKNLSCGVAYRYEIDNERQIIMVRNKKGLLLEIGCSGPAAREYYPQ
jgi:hypothetical protein